MAGISIGPRGRMRLAIAGGVVVALIGALSVVRGVTGGGGSILPHSLLPRYTLNADSSDMVALKKAADLPDCPAPEGNGPLPDLTLPCLGGGRGVDLATLQGPMILIMFYGGCTWCGKALPALAQLETTEGSRIRFLGIDYIDAHPGYALKEVKEYGVRFPLVADFDGRLQGTDMATHGVPVTYAVSRSGTVTRVSGFPTDYTQLLAKAALSTT